MKKKNGSAAYTARAAIIAAMYIVLTYLTNLAGLASGVIQVRISEALTVLPVFTPAAVPGLFLGCLLANILTGCAALDVVFGSLATLIGAVGTRLVGKKNKYLAPVPPIIANTLIIPFVLAYVYHFDGSILYFMLTVGAGELISCGLLGTLLTYALSKRGIKEI